MNLHLWAIIKRHTIHRELAKLAKQELHAEEDEAKLFQDIIHEEKYTAKADQVEQKFEQVEDALAKLIEGEISDINEDNAKTILQTTRSYVAHLRGDEDDTEQVIKRNEEHVNEVIRVVQKEKVIAEKLKSQFSNNDAKVLAGELDARINELHGLYTKEGQELLEIQKELLDPYKKVLDDIDELENKFDLALQAKKEDEIISDDTSLQEDIVKVGELLRQLHLATMQAAQFNEATASIEAVIHQVLEKLTALV